jgi:hypothetical protein
MAYFSSSEHAYFAWTSSTPISDDTDKVSDQSPTTKTIVTNHCLLSILDRIIILQCHLALNTPPVQPVFICLWCQETVTAKIIKQWTGHQKEMMQEAQVVNSLYNALQVEQKQTTQVVHPAGQKKSTYRC